jgi:hypothetical protein
MITNQYLSILQNRLNESKNKDISRGEMNESAEFNISNVDNESECLKIFR